jgi:16S rRNA (guanine527-N7)-methyltransferase
VVFHVKHEGWPEIAGALGLVLDAEQASKLERYERLLIDRAAPFGMIASADIPRIRERHILDSLRAALCVGEARTAYDLGSGGGLPGIPVAIAATGLQVTLVEARRRRASFLELAIDTLELPNASVVHGHVEHLEERVDLALARAFTKAPACWALAEPLLNPQGRLIYFAGEGFDAAQETPGGVRTTLFRSPPLAKSGPLVIMSRQ